MVSIMAVFRVVVAVVFFLSADVPAQKTAQGALSPRRIVGLRYPRLAHLVGIQGTVEAIVTVSPEGKPDQIRIISGPAPLSDGVKDNLSKWLFPPCLQRPDKCETKITFSFVLSGVPCEIALCSWEYEVLLPDKVEVRSSPALAIVD